MSSAHHLFTIVLEAGTSRGAFRDRLTAEGIQTSVHYPPVHRFAIHADGAPDLPLTEQYASCTVTLPLFAHMTTEQQDRVIAAVLSALSSPASGVRRASRSPSA